MTACDALVEGILRSHHCFALVVVPKSMLEEEVGIPLCFVRIFVAPAALFLASGLYISTLSDDIPRASWMITSSSYPKVEHYIRFAILNNKLDLVRSTPKSCEISALFIHEPLCTFHSNLCMTWALTQLGSMYR